MNRLKYHTTYLIGPVDNVSYQDAVRWRQDITPFLQSLGIFVLDPMNKCIEGLNEDKEFFNKKNQLKQRGQYKELHKLGKPIRSYDMRCVDFSSFCIAYLNFDVRMAGSWNEVYLCDSQRKPCLIMCEQGVKEIPDWLFFTFPHEFFFNSFDDLKNYIRGIDDGRITETHNRWWLIDFTKILPPQLQPPKDHIYEASPRYPKFFKG